MAEQFHYTYSTLEQEEVQKIKEKYVAREESKLEQMRRLDKNAEKPGRNVAITLGVIGTLVMGTGMSLIMEFAGSIGIFAAGVIIGLVGVGLMALAYPINQSITKKERAKIADQIVALAEELA